MSGLANVAISWVLDHEGRGERGSFTKDCMAEEDAVRLHEEYKQLQHEKRISCLEVHIKYLD
jgi:hypothetical protein